MNLLPEFQSIDYPVLQLIVTTLNFSFQVWMNLRKSKVSEQSKTDQKTSSPEKEVGQTT